MIAAHIPTAEIGGNYFQETRPHELFRGCSVYCEPASTCGQFPYILDTAVRSVERRGVTVLVVPGDVLIQPVENMRAVRTENHRLGRMAKCGLLLARWRWQ